MWLTGWKSENISDSKNSPEANSSPIKGPLKGIDWGDATWRGKETPAASWKQGPLKTAFLFKHWLIKRCIVEEHTMGATVVARDQ